MQVLWPGTADLYKGCRHCCLSKGQTVIEFVYFIIISLFNINIFHFILWYCLYYAFDQTTYFSNTFSTTATKNGPWWLCSEDCYSTCKLLLNGSHPCYMGIHLDIPVFQIPALLMNCSVHKGCMHALHMWQHSRSKHHFIQIKNVHANFDYFCFLLWGFFVLILPILYFPFRLL